MKIGWQALGGILGPGPRLPMARTLHLWPIWGLFQPLWPPGTAIPGPKIGSNRSAWMCAIPFQPCSKLCHPFRVTTAAYGQNTAFMANLGPLSAPMATWNGHSRSENWFQQVGLDVCYPVPALFQPVPPVQSRHGRLRPEHCIYGHFWHFLAIKWVKMAGTRNTCFGSRSRSTQMTT